MTATKIKVLEAVEDAKERITIINDTHTHTHTHTGKHEYLCQPEDLKLCSSSSGTKRLEL